MTSVIFACIFFSIFIISWAKSGVIWAQEKHCADLCISKTQTRHSTIIRDSFHVSSPLKAGNISIHCPERSLSRSVQEDVFFSVDVECVGVPTIHWTFMSGLVSRAIGTWRPGGYPNITADYSSRVQPCDNGSMGLGDLRLQDAGYYVVTVTDGMGNSRDAGLVLKVNGE